MLCQVIVNYYIHTAPLGEQCSTGDVRLVNGYRVAGRRAAGRLEACFNGVWGTVCRLSSWTNQEAAVVCKQLGFNTTGICIHVDALLYHTLHYLPHSTYCSNSTTIWYRIIYSTNLLCKMFG